MTANPIDMAAEPEPTEAVDLLVRQHRRLEALTEVAQSLDPVPPAN